MRRSTRQRQAIEESFKLSDRPLSPQEVLSAARERVPQLGLATVYRTLKELCASGVLVAVDLPGEAPRYELAGKGHHHHFYCTQCGRLFELGACPSGFAELLPPGFELEGHELLLYGRCRECA